MRIETTDPPHSFSEGNNTLKLRIIRLQRPPGGSYGFHLRGGREHGTGFFISHVEPGSEAYNKGLRTGDQVLRVNQLSVEKAVHKEVASMIQSKDFVTLQVKGTGIIPIKEKRGDPLKWLMVEDEDGSFYPIPEEHSSPHKSPYAVCSNPDSPQFSHTSSTTASSAEGPIRVVIHGNPKNGLGCSICKGPDEKPGIFVQGVRPGGVAWESGLKAGDQILSCNSVSFIDKDFAEAIHLMKSSARLSLEVLRGAGLELVAGESSGYNSSASSLAGDQTPPSAGDYKEPPHHPSFRTRFHSDAVDNRLTAVSRHLQLDSDRKWKDIEAEWNSAEVRSDQVTHGQKRKQTGICRGLVNSRSLTNLMLDTDDEAQTPFRDGPPPPTRRHPHQQPLGRRWANSTTDVRNGASGHKIALATSTGPHVNTVVVTTSPRNEREAVNRLDQLSSSGSQPSSLGSSSNSVAREVASTGGKAHYEELQSGGALPNELHRQLESIRLERERLKKEAKKLELERKKLEEERQGLLRSYSVPSTPLVITCPGDSGSSFYESPPSPALSSSSGRHTSKIIIKSSPPPPPPRDTSTTLSCKHHRRKKHPPLQRQTYTRPPHLVHDSPSPPSSPSTSIGSSSGVASCCSSGSACCCGAGPTCGGPGPTCCGAGPTCGGPRRSKSIGSLSASSGESIIWEDIGVTNAALINSFALCSSDPGKLPHPPPPPPKPAALSLRTEAPPAPPPPPSELQKSSPETSLATAIARELEKRQDKANRDSNSALQGSICIEDKINSFRKDKSATQDPKKAQHDQLMEEFKRVHCRMFKMKSTNEEGSEKTTPVSEDAKDVCSSHPTPGKLTYGTGNSVTTGSPLASPSDYGSTPVSSKIINRALASSTIAPKALDSSSGRIGSTDLRQPKVTITTSHLNDRQELLDKNNIPNQLWSERRGFTQPNASAVSGSSSREEPRGSESGGKFQSTGGPTHATRVPPISSKPLVQIDSYCSTSQRKEPKKLDFLPRGNKVVISAESPMAHLQDELMSTLKRSNLRQKSLPPGNEQAPTDRRCEATAPGRQEAPLPSNVDSTLTSILKNKSSHQMSKYQLHKSISFGDVTTLDSSSPDRNG